MGWRRRTGKPPPADTEPITPDDIARRIGAAGARPARPASPRKPEAEVETGGDRRRVSHAHPVVPGTAGRLILWRDASIVLLAVVAVMLVAQLVFPAIRGGGPGSSGGPGASNLLVLDVTGVPNGSDLPPIGPVVDPSLITGIEATPTPLAVAGPTRRPAPRLTPPPVPSTDPPPSEAPSAPPTADATPTPSPTPTPVPTPSPTPTASPTPEPPPTEPPPTGPPTPPPTDAPPPTGTPGP